jgi:hypothetical protein
MYLFLLEASDAITFDFVGIDSLDLVSYKL